ncbi:MAG TPA: NUDIX hydrolase [Solirubrobacterales bacterium]|nr:NUDIX hydrolase [Solirubrobacterales bacterium]
MEEERHRGPAEEPNFGEPSTPRPAASIVLLRRGGKHSQRALEVLLLKRTEEAKFMPGLWVFPGGSVDAADGEGEGEGEGDAGYRACALRELTEETAIELPADEELVPFSRWITPAIISRRFDAWFYLALAPAHSPPQPDGVEIVAADWFEPAAALAANEAGELPLAFPTRSQLETLSGFANSDEAIAHHRGLTPQPILPVVVGEGEKARIVLPGDPEYPADQILPA